MGGIDWVRKIYAIDHSFVLARRYLDRMRLSLAFSNVVRVLLNLTRPRLKALQSISALSIWAIVAMCSGFFLLNMPMLAAVRGEFSVQKQFAGLG